MSLDAMGMGKEVYSLKQGSGEVKSEIRHNMEEKTIATSISCQL